MISTWFFITYNKNIYCIKILKYMQKKAVIALFQIYDNYILKILLLILNLIKVLLITFNNIIKMLYY